MLDNDMLHRYPVEGVVGELRFIYVQHAWSHPLGVELLRLWFSVV
jgi:hypothetical protein